MKFHEGQILQVTTDVGSDLRIVILDPNDDGEVLYAILGKIEESEYERVGSVSEETLRLMIAE